MTKLRSVWVYWWCYMHEVQLYMIITSSSGTLTFPTIRHTVADRFLEEKKKRIEVILLKSNIIKMMNWMIFICLVWYWFKTAWPVFCVFPYRLYRDISCVLSILNISKTAIYILFSSRWKNKVWYMSEPESPSNPPIQFATWSE